MVRRGQRIFVLGPKYDPAEALPKVTFSFDFRHFTSMGSLHWNLSCKVRCVPSLHVFSYYISNHNKAYRKKGSFTGEALVFQLANFPGAQLSSVIFDMWSSNVCFFY